jgi:transcriptional regulator with XRE-family HTH domain
MKNQAKKFRPMIEARESMGMTQAEFAEHIGISSNYVYLIESGKKPPGPKIIEKLERLESKKSDDFLVQEEAALPYGSPFKIFNAIPTARLETLLKECAEERDWLTIEKVATELANRKITDKLKGDP